MKRKYTKKSTKKRRYNKSKPKNTAIKKMALIPQKCVGLIPITHAGGAAASDNYVFNRYDLGSVYNPYGNYGVNNTRRFQ